jgi:hypothetical protein
VCRKLPCPQCLPRNHVSLVLRCASQPLYGGIKAINREVDWHALDLNDLFASFALHFPHLPFTVFASVPLAQLKFAQLGCQKFRIREVGWQKEGPGVLRTGPDWIWEQDREVCWQQEHHREVRWQQIERLAGRIERSAGIKREERWHRYGEVCWQP